MPRGGYRPGSGRPAGSPTVRLPAPPAGRDPLQFLLDLVEDDTQPVEIRMRAASVALPFVVARPAPETAADRRARAAIEPTGSRWDELLAPPAQDRRQGA